MAPKAPPGRRLTKKKPPMNVADIIMKAFDYTTDGIIIGRLDNGIVLYHNKAWLRTHALDENIDMRGKVFRDYERPELRPILDKVTEELREHGSYAYQFGTIRRDGVYHDVHLAANVIRECDPPVVIVILREVTDLVQMQNEIAHRNVEFALLNEIHQIIARARSRKTVMKQMLQLLGDFIGTGSGIVYLLDRSKGQYTILQSIGVPPAILKRVDRIPLSDPGFRFIMRSPHTAVMEEDTDIKPPGEAEVRPERGIKRVIGFKIKTRSMNDYLVILSLTKDQNVDPAIRRLFDTASKQFAFAIERLELLDGLSKSEQELRGLTKRIVAAGEEERRQCSIMLHDEVGQALTALKLELETLERGLGPLDSCTRKSLEGIRKQVRFVAESTRTIAKSFHPAMLDELGFVPTLSWYIDNFIRRDELDVEFEEAGFDEDLPAPVSLALYRVAQEALTNVVRHAGASRVSISLTRGYPCAIMEIEDNGRGISKQKTKTQGLGLVSMRERIEYMGGSLRITSSPGKGTKVRIKIPIGADNG
ncbi:MAG: ATP-binding protein [Candidatus Krumholzibacteria bacterium]|nr:ATP-binding protein [Candidatus Krumholzibacteria bacterium]